MGKRKTYTEDIMAEAVRLVPEGRHSLARVARDLGIHDTLLGRWKRNFEDANGLSSPCRVVEAARDDELRSLRMENLLHRKKRDILNKRWTSPLNHAHQVDIRFHERGEPSWLRSRPHSRLLLALLLLGMVGCQGASPPRGGMTEAMQRQTLATAQEEVAAAEKRFGASHTETAAALSKLAKLQIHHGHFSEAEPLLQRALKIQEQTHGAESLENATVLMGLAKLYWVQGKLSEAEPLMLRGLQLLEKTRGVGHLDTAQALQELTKIYRSQGRYDESEPLLTRALDIHEKESGPDHPKTASSLIDLAQLYRGQGRHDQVEPLLLRALAIHEKASGPNHPETSKALARLGALYAFQKKSNEAEPLMLRALEIQERTLGSEHPETAATLHALGNLYRRQTYAKGPGLGGKRPDRRAESRNMYQRALSIREKILGPEHPKTIKTLNEFALLLARTNDLTQAFELRQRAFRATNAYLERVMWGSGEKTRQAYLQTQEENVSHYLSLIVALNNEMTAREASFFSLSRKGMLLRIASEIHAVAQSGRFPELSGKIATLTAYKRELAQLLFTGADDVARMDKLKREIYDLESDLGRKVQALGRARNVVDTDAVLSALRPGEILVDYLVFREHELKTREYKDEQLIAVLSDPKAEPAVRIVPLGAMDPILEKIKGYRRAMEESGAADKPMDLQAMALYQALWSPLEPYLTGKETQYIVPDGALHLLSFKALMDQQGRYLGQKTHLVMLSSARDLRLAPLGGNATDPVIIAGPDYSVSNSGSLGASNRGTRTQGAHWSDIYFGSLPGALQEGRLVAEQLRAQNVTPMLITNEAATEQRVAGVHAPRILHLATHGFFLDTQVDEPDRDGNNRSGAQRGIAMGALAETHEEDMGGSAPRIAADPMSRAGLALAGANNGVKGKKDKDGMDGILTAGEAVNLDLAGTDLVILSACQTGVGDVRNGEGVYGLNRAFQEAGAKAVLSTLWSISDAATLAFMNGFYDRFLKGAPPQKALQETQEEFIKNEQWSHPFYWAPFVMVGKDS